jgi:predicted ATPase/class 3 adenylate cyclase
MTRTDLPTGTVTFFFSDVEESTRHATALGERWPAALEAHTTIIRRAVAAAGGSEVSTEGDSFFCVFPDAPAALRAAVEVQQRLEDHPWPDGDRLRVRIGLHSGSGILGGDNYVGLDVHRAARIEASGHGGQVLLSETTRALVTGSLPEGVGLRDLGEHQLRGVEGMMHLYQATVPGLPGEFPPLRTLSAPVRVPAPPTSFVGRKDKVSEVLERLGETRLLTLTGPGGTGKTRLSIAAAMEAADRFPHGVFFVPLEPITDPDLVPTALLGTLGVQVSWGNPEERLTQYLADRELLLVLDNFEQVLDAAPLMGRILAAAPRIRMLVTSRAPLRIYGEQELPVEPLAVPAPGGSPDPDELAGFEAVALFVERARAVRPDFRLDDSNAAAVAQIVTAVDGLPLAVELAAARIRILSPRAIVDRLGNRLALLAGGARDLPARQQTLRAAISWSHDLLEMPSQLLFRRAGVFVGGFDLDQAEPVCGPPEDTGVDTLDGLGELVDQNMLRQRELEGEPRFRMLDTIREFALERLEGAGETAEILGRHAAAYLALAEEAAPHLLGRDQCRWLDRLERDHDNLRAAFSSAVEGGDAATADRLLWALWRFWQIRGHLYEGRRRAEAALALRAVDARLRCRAYEAAGGIAYWKAEFQDCATWYAAALELAREIGDPGLLADALYNSAFGRANLDREDSEGVLAGDANLVEALKIYQQLGDLGGMARALWGRGTMAWFLRRREDIERAVEIYREVSELYRKLDDVFQLGWTERMLGRTLLELGRTEEARAPVHEAMRIFAGTKDVSAVTLILSDFAIIALRDGDENRALRLAGAAAALRESTGTDLADLIQNRSQELIDLLQLRHDDPLLAEGAALTFEEAARYALEEE